MNDRRRFAPYFLTSIEYKHGLTHYDTCAPDVAIAKERSDKPSLETKGKGKSIGATRLAFHYPTATTPNHR